MDLVPWQGWLEAGFNSGGTFPLWHDVLWSFLGSLDSKESACNVEAAGLVPGSGRSPGEGYGNPPWTEEPGGLQSMGSLRAGHE